MEIDLILNELSVKDLSVDLEVDRDRLMSSFIATIKAMKKRYGKINLRTDSDFYGILLSPEYPLRRWLHTADEVERRFLKNLITKYPFSTDIPDLQIRDLEDNRGLTEFHYRGEVAIGLGVAYLLETIAISFLSADLWDLPYLEIDRRQIGAEEIVEDVVEVVHISQASHIDIHGDWIESRRRREIVSGKALWESKEDLFPHLLFCDRLREVLETLADSNPILKQVIKRLFELEKCADEWKEGNFNLDRLPSKASPESESRLREFAEELTWECPDGELRTFSLHLRTTPQAWRLYFYPCQPGKIIIGYIGQKIGR